MKYFVYNIPRITNLKEFDLSDNNNAYLSNAKLAFKGNYTFGELTIEKGADKVNGILLDCDKGQEAYLKTLFKEYKIVKTKVNKSGKTVQCRTFMSNNTRYEVPLLDFYESLANLYILKGFDMTVLEKAFYACLKEYSFFSKYKVVRRKSNG